MKLGLDLRGGVHFLLEVDMNKAIAQRMETSVSDIRRQFRDNNIKFNSLSLNNNAIVLQFANNADRDTAMDFYVVMATNTHNRRSQRQLVHHCV